MSDIYLSITETPAVVTLSQAVISGALASTVTVANTVTVALDSNSLSALEQVTVTVGAAVSVSNFPAIQVVTGSVAVTTMPALSISSVSISNFPFTQTVAGTVTANLSSSNLNAVTVGVRGTVTASGVVAALASDALTYGTGFPIAFNDAVTEDLEFRFASYTSPLPVRTFNSTVTVGNSVTISSLPVQLSTTTIGGTARLNVSIASAVTPGGAIPSYINIHGGTDGSVARTILTDTSGRTVVTVANTVPVSGTFYQATQPVSLASLPASTVTVSSLPASTVTISALPKVTFIDGSGSVTTANTAIEIFATSSTRSYLLVQVTTGSAYINVGATATTANAIYLSSGQGYAWETTIPQGIVSLISTVTGTFFCAKQA